MLIETYQMGYGNCVLKLDGEVLSPSEYSQRARKAIYDETNHSSKIVVGWIKFGL